MTHSDLFDAEKYLFAEFELGGEVEDFLKSAVGRYVLGVATQEIQEAVSNMLDEHTYAAELRKAQRARDAVRWLIEAVQAAKAAELKLRQLDDEAPV